MTIREIQMRATAIVLFCASLCPCALCWSQTGRPVEALPNVNESYQLDYAEDFPALAVDASGQAYLAVIERVDMTPQIGSSRLG